MQSRPPNRVWERVSEQLHRNKEAAMSRNVLKDKSYAFALRIVKLRKYLMDERKEFVLSK